jgi:hypothetical protein
VSKTYVWRHAWGEYALSTTDLPDLMWLEIHLWPKTCTTSTMALWSKDEMRTTGFAFPHGLRRASARFLRISSTHVLAMVRLGFMRNQDETIYALCRTRQRILLIRDLVNFHSREAMVTLIPDMHLHTATGLPASVSQIARRTGLHHCAY